MTEKERSLPGKQRSLPEKERSLADGEEPRERSAKSP